MSQPLLVVDSPSLMYRAFYALPSSIKGPDGRPVNALLGMANLLVQVVDKYRPRAVVLCWGAEAADYRVELFAGYHADRPPVPDDLEHQWEDAEAFFDAFAWPSMATEHLEADDLLGSLARVEDEAGGEALLFTGDRDMFQCVNDSVRVLFPGGKGGPELIDEAAVRARYKIGPGQVPDFIALRGDPSDGIPGAKGIGEKTAAELLRAHGTLEATIAAAAGERPRIAAALRDQAGELRSFKEMATLQPVELERPPDQPTDWVAAAAAARDRGMNRLAERLEALA